MNRAEAASVRILQLEDSADDAELECAALRRAGIAFTSLRVDTREAFAAALDEFRPDLILADYKLPAYDGKSALELALTRRPDVPVVMVSGVLGDEGAADLVKAGAVDYVLKDHLGRLAGAVHAALTLAQDRRELQQMERALQASELRYRRLFEAARDGVLILDGLSGAIVDVNPFLIELTGYSRAELLGKKLWEVGAFADIDESKKAFATLQDKGYVRYEDLQLKKKGGGMIDVEFVSNAYDAGGERVYQCNIRDITERAAVERALQAAQQLTGGILESIPVRVFWKDRNLVFLGCNTEFASDAGFADARDIIGKDDFQMSWREHAEAYRADDRAVIDSGRPKRLIEESQTTPEGKTITLLTSKVPLRGAGGEIIGVLGAYQDITELKQAEQGLKLFRALVDRANDAIEVLEPETLRYLDINQTACSALGYSREELLAKSVLDIDTEMTPARAGGIGKQVRETGSALFESVHRRKDGSTFPVEVNVRQVELDRTYLVTAVRDISERKRAAEAEARRETWFRSLIENIEDVVLVLNAEGIISYVSPSVKRLGGYEPAELVGTSHAALTHPDDLDQATQRLATLLRDPDTAVRAEARYRAKDGSWRVVETANRNLLALAGVNGIVVTMHDITERKRQEHALLRVNRALKTLSAANSAVVHATSEAQLLQDMCRAVVGVGGYRLAWVGYAEQDAAKKVRPVAIAGPGADFVQQTDITWADSERGRGPTGRCIRSGEAQLARDNTTDLSMGPWREAALKHGFQSGVALPLRGPAGVFGALMIYAGEVNAFDADELALLSEMAGDLAYGITALRTRAAGAESLLRLERSMEATVQALATTVELRDPYTAGHQRRVAALATAIAQELQMDEERVRGLNLAATIHDIGKISVPAEILAKPGKLTAIEYELVKGHAAAGYEILKNVEFPWPVAEIIHQHHERLDGSGYPRGLRAEQILVEAKILAVADTLEAIASHRPYRSARGLDAALAEVATGRGTLFDAATVDACLKLFREKGFALPT